MLTVGLLGAANLWATEEAECVKAACGTDGQVYPWGNAARLKYGTLDIAGNELEWTQSQYNAYPYDALNGRENLTGGPTRVLHGGSYLQSSQYVRCSARNNDATRSRFGNIGFRVLIPADERP